MMTRHLVAVAIALAFVTTPAFARHHHYRHHHHRTVHQHHVRHSVPRKVAQDCVEDNNGRTICENGIEPVGAYVNKTVTGTEKIIRRVVRYIGAGTVVSHKTGATATVSAHARAAFQAYIDDIEAHGGTVRFMGGNRRGHCSPRHMHSCGLALDVCQYSRDRVDSRCHLPSREALARIAASHGLFEGGQWCHGDYGHAQLGVSAQACGSSYAARRHHRRHYKVARR